MVYLVGVCAYDHGCVASFNLFHVETNLALLYSRRGFEKRKANRRAQPALLVQATSVQRLPDASVVLQELCQGKPLYGGSHAAKRDQHAGKTSGWPLCHWVQFLG